MPLQRNVSTNFAFFLPVDKVIHIIPTDMYEFINFINKLDTRYPLSPVDNRTVVPNETIW